MLVQHRVIFVVFATRTVLAEFAAKLWDMNFASSNQIEHTRHCHAGVL
jgi:hypothetical protein